MKRKTAGIWAGIMVLIIMLALAGCGGAASPDNTQGQAGDKSAGGSGKSISIGDLASKYRAIPGMYFEMEMKLPETGQPVLAKFWMEKDNMRSEMASPDGSGTMINIVNGSKQEAYMIMGNNMAMRIDISQAQQGVTSPGDTYKDIDQAQAKMVGREKVDGKECLVYEFSEEGQSGKYWIWEEYGLPVKAESTIEGEKIVFEYKNVKVEDIADSMFELPAGVELMDMPDMSSLMQNLPGQN